MRETNPHLAITEQVIIQGCAAGKRASQTMLYDRYAPRMMALCMRYSKNREEAEEVLLEGFHRVFRNIRQYKQSGSFEGWVRKVMVNAALQRYKPKSKLYPILPIAQAAMDIPDYADIESGMEAKELTLLVQSLPTGYRMVFNLHVFEGYKHREIAAMLGISEGTSKSNLFDARALLRKSLGAKARIHAGKKISI